MNEYEEIYHTDDSSRLNELNNINKILKKLFKRKNILEIACGTGFWTQLISERALNIIATDILEEMLDAAKNKKYHCPVKFKIENGYDLSFQDNEFDAGLANFWFSHIPREKIFSFLKNFHRVLKNKAVVFFADNNYMKNIGRKLLEVKNNTNTFKIRKLKNGSKYKIIKNYYSKEELKSIFSIYDSSFSESNVFYGENIWYVSYCLDD